jgi:hypothetical protein
LPIIIRALRACEWREVALGLMGVPISTRVPVARSTSTAGALLEASRADFSMDVIC